MKIFPSGPIQLGTVAELSLANVTRTPEGVVARYRVKPKDETQFMATFSGIGEALTAPYEPCRGSFWSMYDIPEDRDEVNFIIGVPSRSGKALIQARQELHPRATHAVPETTVKAMARGLLQRESGA